MLRLTLVAMIAACGGQQRRDEIIAEEPALTKQDVRPTLKALVERFKGCFVDAGVTSGVLNVRLAIESDPATGTKVRLLGFETDGKPPPAALHACVAEVLDNAAQLAPAISARGRIELVYPLTFAASPPDNHDLVAYDAANRAAKGGEWQWALTAAEQGLQLTSLDGIHRRRLIEIAGVAACHLGIGAKAQHYIELASPEVELVVRARCKETGTALPPNNSATH